MRLKETDSFGFVKALQNITKKSSSLDTKKALFISYWKERRENNTVPSEISFHTSVQMKKNEKKFTKNDECHVD
jgi:hypothetical protein